MTSVLIINGFDFTPYVVFGDGFNITYNQVDSEDAGELLDYTMRRDRAIVKVTISVTLNPFNNSITDSIIYNMLQSLEPQWLNVTYYDPRKGSMIQREFYTADVSPRLVKVHKGKRYWTIDNIELVERGVPGDGRWNLD